MIYFNLPGLYEHFDLNIFFLHLYNENREYFRNNVQIQSIFGNFPYCTWDGGRNFPFYEQVSKERIQYIKNSYNAYNVNTRFIFTNPVLEKEDLDDRFCNLVLSLCQDDQHSEVVINSDLMKEYIQQNYPQYKIISSTTKCITNKEKALLEIQDDDYYQICLDYNLNKDKDFLQTIPMQDRSKVEFLTNAICPSNCPHRKKHYSQTGLAHLTFLKEKYSVVPYCKINNSVNDPSKLGKGNNLSNEDIIEYNKMGYQHFKLEGRTLDGNIMFANYLYYLIKPEYYFLVIELIGNTDILFNNYNHPRIYELKGEKTSRIISY